MKELIQYLIDNKIQFKEIDDNYLEIDNRNFNLVYLTEDNQLFSKDFELLIEYKCDNYVYEFGGKYYYEEVEDILAPKLTPLKYIGKSVSDFETDLFLGVHGGYDILNGSRTYGDWCKKAKFLGCKTLGICEKNTLAGALKFQLECIKNDIKPIIGATYTIFREKDDFRYDVKVYVKDVIGWETILKINKEVLVFNNKFINEERFLELLEGLILVIDPKSIKFDQLPVSWYDTNKDIYYQLDTVVFNDNSADKEYLLNLKDFYCSVIHPIPICDAYYLDAEDFEVKKLLNSISSMHELKSVNQYFKDKEDYLNELSDLVKDEDTYYNLFDQLGANELYFNEDCDFSISVGTRYLPKYAMTDEEKSKFKTNKDLFWNLIETGLVKKIPEEKFDIYLDRIDEEVAVIELGNIVDYFLILWDIIKYARKNNILVGIGRGSAGGSVVSYLLDIIQIDPMEFDLLFSRFLNEGRVKKSMPDIDTDFPTSKREQIKNYMEQRYGIEQVCAIGTYTALQVKAAIKDLSKQANVDFAEVNQVTTLIPNIKKYSELFKFSLKNNRIKSFIKSNSGIINDVNLVLHQPKAKSVHACAMLILPKEKSMFEWLPICSMGGQMVSEWEGGELEQAGFLKEDILAIRQLDKFQDILDLIKLSTNEDIDIYSIPLDNKKVYEYFSKGWNEDTFHFGSPGLTGYCKELLPSKIDDLIAGISLYRPGAMENNFHNEYILRKTGQREIEYFIGSEDILKPTYGVFVYQEQIMKLCQVLGGLTMVEADDVRKAMVKKKYDELTKYKIRFIPYYVKNFGVTEEYSSDVWDTIDKASTYLFNKSHATAYAVTGYISQWFKVNYPLAYWSTAFKHAKEEDHANYINEINQIGEISIMPVDINKSRDSVFTDFETKTIFWPFDAIKQLGEKAATQLIEERDKNGQYFSFDEFLDRHKFKGSKVGKAIIENLILSGAFDLLEKISTNNGRLNLIQKYHRLAKVKLDPLKDIFTLNKDLLNENWWWTLQQKRLSGIAFFDYKSIMSKYLEKGFFLDPKDYQNEGFAKQRKKALVAGYISEVEERESKKKGKWARLVIETNYTFLNITIWSDHWSQLTHLDLVNKNKCLLLMKGQLVWDSFKNCNVLQSCDDSEMFVLE